MYLAALLSPLISLCWANDIRQLFQFVKKNDFQNVKDILNEANFVWSEKAGQRCLDHAIRHGETRMVSALLEKGCPAGGVLDAERYTFLHLAVLYGRYDVLELLLARKPRLPLNFESRSGHTPLYVAISMGNVGKCMALALLREGADHAYVDKLGNTLLHVAAVDSGMTDVVKCLVYKGVPLNVENDVTEGSNTALMCAMMCNCVHTVAFLLEANAKADILCQKSNSLLHYAVNNSDGVRFVDTLLKKGAPADVKNFKGITAVDVIVNAKNFQNIDVAVKLMACGADLSAESARELWKRTFAVIADGEESGGNRKNFDDCVIYHVETYLAGKLDGNLEDTLQVCDENYLFVMYRMLAMKYYNERRSEISQIETRKCAIFDVIMAKLAEKTYLSFLPLEMVSDVFPRYYWWKVEKLAFHLALATYSLNLPLNEALFRKITPFVHSYIYVE